ncbi:MAG TPA: bifunctional 4-hydroxy-2-oxoglutarate aldolase/2-dehydro-3-deoxy-phosphogluconate aldolase [Candidatus Baltobacterales bacterium]|nr:bifunctional 4-hydroxy-2-oxoglutarate aldolase/2-dehydro-3-deoxy-phosphogluconate aldolase [Candidatus Baltobacterales bacterium]
MADVLQRLRKARVVIVVRADDASNAVAIAEALVDGGLVAVELTYTTPGAGAAIEKARSRLDDRILLGAGTLTTPEQVGEAVAAGADFLVSPHLNRGLLNTMLESGRLALPGVLTPSEVAAAFADGAEAVKLFPASSGGIAHLQALFGPFPEIKVVPTGGIAPEDVGAWLEAGAWAVGVGGKLAPRRLENDESRSELVKRSRSLCAQLRQDSTR